MICNRGDRYSSFTFLLIPRSSKNGGVGAWRRIFCSTRLADLGVMMGKNYEGIRYRNFPGIGMEFGWNGRYPRVYKLGSDFVGVGEIVLISSRNLENIKFAQIVLHPRSFDHTA